jgi:hypothetical protein
MVTLTCSIGLFLESILDDCILMHDNVETDDDEITEIA